MNEPLAHHVAGATFASFSRLLLSGALGCVCTLRRRFRPGAGPRGAARTDLYDAPRRLGLDPALADSVLGPLALAYGLEHAGLWMCEFASVGIVAIAALAMEAMIRTRPAL